MSNLNQIGVARKHHVKTIGATAFGGLTATERQDANGNEPVAMLLQNTTANNVRITFDGTTPTATTGLQLTSTTSILLVPGLANITNLDAIREAATDGELQIVLFY